MHDDRLEQVSDTASAEGPAPTTTTEMEELRRQLDETQDRLLRTLAEMDNIRRRSQREREEYTRYATEALLGDLVPVLDNLDRALTAARATGEAAKVVEGVELIQRELLRVLERQGVHRYSALGQPFDPTRHEATARVISGDQPPGTVVSEVVPGYMLHSRVLRAAQVAVAAAPDEDAA
jgi:molecular chaperone GrpE